MMNAQEMDAQAPATPDPRLLRLLGAQALAPLRQRLRRQIERQDRGEAGQRWVLTRLAPHELDALAAMIGRPASLAHSLRLDVDQLDQRLRAAGIAASLRDALEQLDGPIVDRLAAHATVQAAWRELVASAASLHASLRGWLSVPGSVSLLRRLARQDTRAAGLLLAQADRVLCRLPCSGLPRAQLAAECLGNAHALDPGQAVATLVLAVWRYAESQGASPGLNDAEADAEQPESAEESTSALLQGSAPASSEGLSGAQERLRDVWARAGVLVNELARPALVLNLPATGGPAAHWPPGEPVHLSLRLLVRTPPRWAVAGLDVHVCENPNLLAIAADRLGPRCAPLVCTEGMPAAAQRTLLTQLVRAGARLHYHGDFDAPGLQIANHVVRRWQARPWRMATADYEAAVSQAPHHPHDLPDTRVEASWDAQLAAALRRHGLAIAEEAVADALIEDLGNLERGP